MRSNLIGVLLLTALFMLPNVSFAKGIPLFFQTGDELFEIEGAPQFDGGYSIGYACQHFGLFGADVWTWNCRLMAINMAEFAAGELNQKEMSEYSTKFSLSDRKRGFWNHYGIITVILLLAAVGIFKKKSAA